MIYIVTYEGFDGETYKTLAQDTTEYNAICKVADCVNNGACFGMDFKAEIHPAIR